MDSDGLGVRSVAAVRMDAPGADALANMDAILYTEDPNDASNVLNVFAPRSLVADAETGVLVTENAGSLAALLGEAEARSLLPEPKEQVLISGGQYVKIGAIASSDAGATFREIPAERTAAHPVNLVMDGLTFTDGYHHRFFAHPSAALQSATGLVVQPTSGDWSKDGVSNLTAGRTSLRADLTAFPVVAPYEGANDDADETGCYGLAKKAPRTGAGSDIIILLGQALALTCVAEPSSLRRLDVVDINEFPEELAKRIAVNAFHESHGRARMLVQHARYRVRDLVAPPEILLHCDEVVLDEVQDRAHVELRILQKTNQQFQRAVSAGASDSVHASVDVVDAFNDAFDRVGEGKLLVVVTVDPNLLSWKARQILFGQVMNLLGIEIAEAVDKIDHLEVRHGEFVEGFIQFRLKRMRYRHYVYGNLIA